MNRGLEKKDLVRNTELLSNVWRDHDIARRLNLVSVDPGRADPMGESNQQISLHRGGNFK